MAAEAGLAPAGELAAETVLLLEEDRRTGRADCFVDGVAGGDTGGEAVQALQMAERGADDRDRGLALLEHAAEGAVERGGVALGGGEDGVVHRQRGGIVDRGAGVVELDPAAVAGV